MDSNHPLAKGLALLFFLLMTGFLVLRYWAVEVAWEKSGPTHVAAGENHIFLFAADELFRFSVDGTTDRQFPMEISGVRDHPIDLQVTDDGRLLLAEQRPARIRLCDTDNWACEETGSGLWNELSRQFKIRIDTPWGFLLATDARGDRLWRIATPGGAAEALLPTGTLAGPNEFVFDNDSSLWIADTDHRRIIEWIRAENGEPEPGRELTAVNHLTRGERFFPMMLDLAPDGFLWVIQGAEFSKGTADVLIYHAEEGAVSRIEFPEQGYPTDIAATGTDMLVTDLEAFRVYRIDTRTHKISEFGDESFKALMDGLKARRDHHLRVSTLAMAGVVLFGVLMIITAVRATPTGKRWTQATPVINFDRIGEPPPTVSRVHWLERDRKVERMLVWGERLFFILPLLMVLVLLAAIGWGLSRAGPELSAEIQQSIIVLGLLLVVFMMVSLGLIPLLRLMLRPLKHRLGSDGKRLFVRLHDGRELAIAPSDLHYTRRAVHYQNHSFPFQNGRNQGLYVSGEVEQWVVPLLRGATEMTQVEALKHRWKHRDELLVGSIVSGIALALLLILLSALRACL